ncbi:MAG: hypothetical protein CM15mP84_08240 [Cellvibrionales bacterium]|nr:MAG: hypothetical protein CM15mP84_08240 [Cellvibrionales bacterium]
MRALEEARLASNSPSEQLERFLLTLLDAGNEEVLLVTSRALASASYIDIDFDQWPLQPLFDELRLLSSVGDGSAKETQERSFALVYGLIGSASFLQPPVEAWRGCTALRLRKSGAGAAPRVRQPNGVA